LSDEHLTRLADDLDLEAEEKLRSWRRRAAALHSKAFDGASDRPYRIGRLQSIQMHLDSHAENTVRKRRARGQLLGWLLGLAGAVAFGVIVLEMLDHGLLLADGDPSRSWVLSAALYGLAGGAVSAATRVATSQADASYPEQLQARLAHIAQAAVGAIAGLIAFAGLEIGLFGANAVSGPRVAVIAFAAGFTERILSGLVSSA
jgi:hypothetical protein